MKPITTILTATDFTPSADRAEERAAMLAAMHGARLVLVHCLSGLVLERLRARLLPAYADAEAQLTRHFEDALRRLAEDLAGRWQIEVMPRLAIGQPHREISRAAQEIGADLIVLGAMGEHPAREFFLGSTAERVIRAAAAPVLVVRNAPNQDWQRVLVALDLSPHSPAVAGLARRVAPAAELTLAHAFEVPFEGKLQFAGVSEADIHRYRQQERLAAQDALSALAESLQDGARPRIRVGIRIEHGMPEAVIPALLRETAADLVVVGKHGKSEIVDLFIGSMTKHLLLESPCDVLVAPPGGDSDASESTGLRR